MRERPTTPAIDALNEAIAYQGSAARLARLLNLTPAAVSNWRRRGHVPPEWAPEIERHTGVSRKRLAPELYQYPIKKAPAEPGPTQQPQAGVSTD